MRSTSEKFLVSRCRGLASGIESTNLGLTARTGRLPRRKEPGDCSHRHHCGRDMVAASGQNSDDRQQSGWEPTTRPTSFAEARTRRGRDLRGDRCQLPDPTATDSRSRRNPPLICPLPSMRGTRPTHLEVKPRGDCARLALDWSNRWRFDYETRGRVGENQAGGPCRCDLHAHRATRGHNRRCEVNCGRLRCWDVVVGQHILQFRAYGCARSAAVVGVEPDTDLESLVAWTGTILHRGVPGRRARTARCGGRHTCQGSTVCLVGRRFTPVSVGVTV